MRSTEPQCAISHCGISRFRVRSCGPPRNDKPRLPRSHRHLAMQDWGAGGEAFSRIDDGVGVKAVVTVEIRNRAGLAELLDAERLDAMAADAAEPAERRRMAVDHGHDA